jgi:hypothetical protein
MRLKSILMSIVAPPVGACKYGCGTNCAAPISVFWLFGMISVIYGFMGGPSQLAHTSWETVGLGVAMWAIAATWTILTADGVEADRCHDLWSPKDHHVDAKEDEADPLDEINKFTSAR